MATHSRTITRTPTHSPESARNRTLRQSLELQRAQLLQATRTRIRDARCANTGHADVVLDMAEVSEADIQEELDFALIEMYSETLGRIDDALESLALGEYGNCVDCGGPIAARRLEALPFALRCTGCEERREAGMHHPFESASWVLVKPELTGE